MIAKTLQDMFQRYRRPGDVVFAVLFLAFSVFLLSQLGEQTKVVKRTKWFAQPGLWPTVALWMMVIFSFLHWLSSVMSERISGRWAEVGFWARSFEYVAYFLIYVMLVPKLGYLPSTMLFAVFLTLRAGFRGASTIAIAAAFGFVVTIVFRAFLQVKIPAGAIYEHFPETIRAFALTYL
ncbi:tripartite tricarboxylate transporter TctB family protein [uncultured Ruegeria sp.]|uniref:tripartite tricarboxylate transporter TctB family protein n=1 Tax=uncultured Ruegeria sp. TaxID=259304 RepID=UPI00260A3781|nr:tripartite tricarboxylate transporter TctB family protein [uncultured Ruegeria sp.]